MNGDIALSGRELSNQSWQTGTENEYLVYRYDPKTFYGSYATGSLDKLPLLSPEFENNTIRFSLDGREKITRPVRRIIPLFRRAGMLRPVLPAVSITEQPLHMQVVSVRWSLHLY